ncbi:unnamed protein product [Coregonus sp. 'balchen']|nr:unnamed protein product [Coregonus sp. 'balchen']
MELSADCDWSEEGQGVAYLPAASWRLQGLTWGSYRCRGDAHDAGIYWNGHGSKVLCWPAVATPSWMRPWRVWLEAEAWFVRVHSSTDPVLIYQMLTEQWGLAPPHLVVALVGGDELSQMKPWLRDTVRKGLHLGQAVRDHSLASTNSKVKVVAIGIAPWNMIHNRDALLAAKLDQPAMVEPRDLPHGAVYSLDCNHSHFVLVDEDPQRPGATSEMRVQLLKHISLQRTGYGGAGSFEIPVLCLLDFLDELKLAVAWNRVDIAKSHIFNGDVEWTAGDLEEVMMDALVNDKPDFVRLFVDNGVCLGKFLTYGRLQELYCSVSEKSLLHLLLLKKHQEKQLLLKAARTPGPPHDHHKAEPGDRKARFTLHEVSKVLKDFLHDSCKGFYQKLPTEKTGQKAGRLFNNQKSLAELEEQCEHPWRDLFLWAVLQNRQQMANYFWAMGPEAVAAALAGCKILKEMSGLESEAESARSMKEAKYEQFALDLFGECYSNSEDRAYALLVRRTRCWNQSTVLNLATEADAKCFFAHDGVQGFLTKIWWGAMTTDTAISRLVLSFFCPPLIWTNLIKFSDEELDSRGGGEEQYVELDSLDTEKGLLLTDHGPLDSRGPPDGVEGQSSAAVWWRFLLRRWHRFWSAPVTVFLGNVIMYFAFLILFTYSFFTDEDMSILKKFKLYAGRTVLALDFMVFTLRLIHIFAIHKQLGPKIIIVERMMKDVFFFLFFLSVWLIAYGVATQALLHPNDPRLDWVFRRVLYRPYLHIFGQIPLEEIDEARMPDTNCTTEIEEIIMGTLPPCPNIYANWLVILLLVIFLLVTNVLLLNLLIAMFSYTFQVVQGNTDIFWKFQRYNLIVEYHSRPALAPPFIIISHCSQLLLSLRELPAGLDQRLITWETVQKENYLAKLEHQHLESSEERLKSTSSKVQSLLKIVGGFKEQEKRMSSMEAQATGFTGAKASTSRNPHQNVSDKEVKPERREAKPGPSGYGANKRFPYIDK